MGSFLEIDDLLNPISEADPVGEDLRYEDEYFELEEARRADEDSSSQGDWERSRKLADWNKVLSLSQKLLTRRSKDLQIAAWLVEALFQIHGLPGYKEGIDLLRELQARFWDKAHPGEGDLELRRGVYEFLDDERIFALRVKNLPVTEVRAAPELSYSFLKYRESRESENLLKRLTRDDDPEEILAGRLRAAQFDKAFEVTERQFYVDLIEHLGECRAALEALNDDIRARWTEKSKPGLSLVPAAIEEVERLAKQLLAKKPAAAPTPDPELEAPGDETEEAADESDAWSWGEPAAEVAEQPAEEAPKARPRKPRPVQSDDPRAQIALAAHALRQADRSDPTSYAVLRALSMGKVYQAGESLRSAAFPAPRSEVRARLHGLENAGDDFATLIDESEQALGEPEGAAWLDLQRYSLIGLVSEGHADAVLACRTLLDACLRDKTDWPATHFNDGTPCASESTRSWIAEEKLGASPAPDILPRRLSDTSDEAPPSEDGLLLPTPAAPREPDPWDQALRLRQSGRTPEAIALLGRAARQARTGRERFLRTLEQAELCLADNRVELALPLIEGLSQRVDEFHLDQWEDSSLCARVFSALYRCLRGRDEARARGAYNRLCQLDLTEALALESP